MSEWQGYYVIALLMILVGQRMQSVWLEAGWWFMAIVFAAIGTLSFLP